MNGSFLRGRDDRENQSIIEHIKQKITKDLNSTAVHINKYGMEGACRVYSTVRRVCCVVFPVFWILFIADVSCLLCVLLFDRAPRATVPIVPVPVEHSVWELMYLFVGVNDAPKLPPTYVLLYGSRN